MKIIYLVQTEEVDNIEKISEDEKAFQNKEDAIAHFNETIERIKSENNLEDWEIDESMGEWCAYPDGQYLDKHFLVTWKALPLH